MKEFVTPLFMVGMLAAQSQPVVPNGTFSDSLGNCSLDHWSTFCNATMLTFGCDDCGLGIAPNNGPSPCPYATSPTGMHTRLQNVPVGVPLELTFCAIVDDTDGGDVGIFHTDPGETPLSYYGDGIVEVWYVWGIDNTAVTNIINFTIPTAYAGKDLWLFLEYSFAPDNDPQLKFYDDLMIEPVLSTSIEEAGTGGIVSLDPVQRDLVLAPDRAGEVAAWEVVSMTGARMTRASGHTVVRADAWAPGIYVVRAQLRDGTTLTQRVML